MSANPAGGYDRRISMPDDIRSGLDTFYETVKNCLLCDPRIEIAFPPGTKSQGWPAKEIVESNTRTFDDLEDNGNLYAIFAGGRNCIWMPKYVGTSKSKDLNKRFREHLVAVAEGTNSKLREVQREVFNGGKIAIAYVMVEPENVREYVEKRIISEERGRQPGRLCWNKRI